MKKIKFAIIGCGRIAYRHIEAIRANHEAELVALCDLNLERAEERNKNVGVNLYRNYNEMLKNEEIDVVSIMTPNGMHPEHAIDVITKFKKHIVLEKPICLSVQDGMNLINTAEKNGVQLFAVHQNRYNKAIQKVKNGLDNNYFGKISLATIRVRWSRGQSYYDRDPWRGTWALDGGALTNQAVHHIDLLRWLIGDVESLSAYGKTQFVNVEVEDTACAWLKFKNGALGIIEATTTARPLNHDLEASISVMGENGVAIVEGFAVNKLTTWTFDSINLDEFSEDPPNVYGFGHDKIVANVVDVLKRGGQPFVSGQDALKSVKLLSAIYRSIELNGKEVFMDENPVSERFGIFSPKYLPTINLYRTDEVLGK